MGSMVDRAGAAPASPLVASLSKFVPDLAACRASWLKVRDEEEACREVVRCVTIIVERRGGGMRKLRLAVAIAPAFPTGPRPSPGCWSTLKQGSRASRGSRGGDRPVAAALVHQAAHRSTSGFSAGTIVSHSSRSQIRVGTRLLPQRTARQSGIPFPKCRVATAATRRDHRRLAILNLSIQQAREIDSNRALERRYPRVHRHSGNICRPFRNSFTTLRERPYRHFRNARPTYREQPAR